MRTTRAFAILIVLQALILAGQWLGSPSLPTVQAQPAFNPERDRTEMIEQLRAANDKLEKVIGILQAGDLQVRVVTPDEKKADRPAR